MRTSFRINFLAALIMMIGIGGTTAHAALDTEKLTIGGEIRERGEFRQNADFNNNADDSLSFIGSRIRVNLGYEIAPEISFFFQMEDSRVFGYETTTTTNSANLDIHQGYLLIKNLVGPASLTLGRQEMLLGDSRLIGNSGWGNVGRSFDGLRFAYLKDALRIDLFGMTVKKTAASPDPALTPAVANEDSQHLYGLYASLKASGMTIEPYLLFLQDTQNGLLTSNLLPGAAGQTRETLGVRIDKKGDGNPLDFTAELAYQTGSMDAHSNAPKANIQAYAMALKAGYTLPAAYSPRIGIEYDLASGDDNTGDDSAKTFENLFPTNHAQYGYMDYVGWRNMKDLRISVSAKPAKTVKVSLDYHMLALASTADNWYAASGAIFRTTPAGNAETEMGQELDLTAGILLKEKLQLDAGYGHFSPGSYISTNFPTAKDGSDFLYLQLGVGF
jgi:hypothetical protein